MPHIDDARIPKYGRHKPTGQAVVSLSGKDIYLGPHGSKKSRAAYDRLTGEWLAAGRCFPKSEADLTVAELMLRYWRFCQDDCVKNGEQSRYLDVIKRLPRLTGCRPGEVCTMRPCDIDATTDVAQLDGMVAHILPILVNSGFPTTAGSDFRFFAPSEQIQDGPPSLH